LSRQADASDREQAITGLHPCESAAWVIARQSASSVDMISTDDFTNMIISQLLLLTGEKQKTDK
jgi:hypothetical protein